MPETNIDDIDQDGLHVRVSWGPAKIIHADGQACEHPDGCTTLGEGDYPVSGYVQVITVNPAEPVTGWWITLDRAGIDRMISALVEAGHAAFPERTQFMTQIPSVGRVVHYVSYGTPAGEYTSQCRAADITEVDPHDEGLVGLMVKNPTGLFFYPLAGGGSRYHEGDVGHDHTGEEIPARSYPGGTWHWPERV